ncbi:TetR/AcrR family transcriptional regulator [uncultured Desulfosarcina sp.]|uniref:TetR/AcrR family transcriptional regulator n=1 Tax=uncultured Desulfosarcina sp. TaxID=218289 RepID=UPI0029C8F031|nr:TetR/AcrR family transcriptional regulator [uncultured Desulfosarcina sp.]
MNNKVLILATGIRPFAGQSHEATTALHFARDDGVTAPAVFYHSKNKQTVYSTILEDAADRYLKRALVLSHGTTEYTEYTENFSISSSVSSACSVVEKDMVKGCPQESKVMCLVFSSAESVP